MSESLSFFDDPVQESDFDVSELELDDPDRRPCAPQGSYRRSVQPLVSGQRTRDPKVPGLIVLRSANSLYTAVLPYRSYRLVDTTATKVSLATGKVSDFKKQMSLKLSDHLFSGNDSIMVPDFLSRFVRKANIKGMTEAQTLIALPSLLTGFVRSQYDAEV